MKKLILTLMSFWLVLSCSNKGVYEKLSHNRQDAARDIPYELMEIKDSRKLVVFLKDNIDTIEIKETPFESYFTDQDYNILIPGKPGKNEYNIQVLDKKEARLKDLHALISQLDSLRQGDLVIVGFGEGGYLAPELGQLTKANVSLSINAGPFSPVQELTNWSNADTIVEEAVAVLKEMNVKSKDDLREKLQKIEEDPFGEQIFPDQTNAYHISYKEDPLAYKIQYITVPVYFIISKDAPMVTVESQNVLSALSSSFAPIHYAIIPGIGSFNQEKEQKLLIEQMDEFLMKRQSY